MYMKIETQGNLPQRMSASAAGGDLIAIEDYSILPGEVAFVDTGTRMAIPEGFFGMLVPRSSIANKRGLMLANSAGIVDSDYRGPILLAYRNLTTNTQFIGKGERIGQIIIVPYVSPTYSQVEELDETVRGTGGFGHTGTGLEGSCKKAKKFEPCGCDAVINKD